ncbi:ADP-glyceromanno-heptose 6-epimerase [Mycolicibacterium aichiense]|uniref:ADP-L-glycero-D-manno-heptose-6-epimerase n=1 Tax=Mycolicibacterium aichiense TaxID=1799 RepID=A0AAD1HVQ4_9MYCO|nr:ADP-glyceromanno-heptose 6-epimerase [Mycolicibacterium aichiense]MCV7016380.1 ADP-glyceromanno-heptose 6-epimerase [Mycolicibacterium aichiense]BBX09846.1 ADP-L-glycero-D-manno-heptose-6-epimerase [Mycolicibacterium aichiense]
MHVITGGAGFIGSNIAAELDQRGEDIVVVDMLGDDDMKWRNIAKRRLRDLITPDELPAFLSGSSRIESIIHMGAISSTVERDVDLIIRNNFRLSVDLWNWCTREGIPYIYASSAATYGDGGMGFVDEFDDASLGALRPLNPYGWSKHAFDRWVHAEQQSRQRHPPKWAGLKFFNVYGPNEYHKGGQRSVALQLFEQIRDNGVARLFASNDPDYVDGGQTRDFVWVGDCVTIALWLLGTDSAPSSVYNVGSGVPRTFGDKARIIFELLDQPLNIEFITLPEELNGKYQNFTLASLDKLRQAGYDIPTTSLEDGLKSYIEDYLRSPDIFR